MAIALLSQTVKDLGYRGRDLKGIYKSISSASRLCKGLVFDAIAPNHLRSIQEVALQNPKLDDALRDRLARGIAELNAIAELLE